MNKEEMGFLGFSEGEPKSLNLENSRYSDEDSYSATKGAMYGGLIGAGTGAAMLVGHGVKKQYNSRKNFSKIKSQYEKDLKEIDKILPPNFRKKMEILRDKTNKYRVMKEVDKLNEKQRDAYYKFLQLQSQFMHAESDNDLSYLKKAATHATGGAVAGGTLGVIGGGAVGAGLSAGKAVSKGVDKVVDSFSEEDSYSYGEDRMKAMLAMANSKMAETDKMISSYQKEHERGNQEIRDRIKNADKIGAELAKKQTKGLFGNYSDEDQYTSAGSPGGGNIGAMGGHTNKGLRPISDSERNDNPNDPARQFLLKKLGADKDFSDSYDDQYALTPDMQARLNKLEEEDRKNEEEKTNYYKNRRKKERQERSEKSRERSNNIRRGNRTIGGALVGAGVGYGLGKLSTHKLNKKIEELHKKKNKTPKDKALLQKLIRKSNLIYDGVGLASTAVGAGIGYSTHKDK